MHNVVLLSVLCALVTGCALNARNPDRYRDDTQTVLRGVSPQIRNCYDAVLQKDAEVGGEVVVNFTVEKNTGVFKDVAVDRNATTAPDGVVQCVVQALSGLRLEPEDGRDGLATFSWSFQPPETEESAD